MVQTGAATLAPVAPAKKHSKLMEDLVAAMRTTAEATREQALVQVEADVRQVVDAIRAQSTAGAEAIRHRSEEDIAGIREWSKAEIARIREETERRIGDRKSMLEADVAGHAAAIERRVDEVQHVVAGYQADMADFFERLLQESDPARLATMAETMPEPPLLEAHLDPESSAGTAVASEMAPAAVAPIAAWPPDDATAVLIAPAASEADEARDLADRAAMMAALEAAAEAAAAEAVASERPQPRRPQPRRPKPRPPTEPPPKQPRRRPRTPRAPPTSRPPPTRPPPSRCREAAADQAAAEAVGAAAGCRRAGRRRAGCRRPGRRRGRRTRGGGRRSRHDPGRGCVRARHLDRGPPRPHPAEPCCGHRGRWRPLHPGDRHRPRVRREHRQLQATPRPLRRRERRHGRVRARWGVRVHRQPPEDVSFRDVIPTVPGFAARVTSAEDGVVNVMARDPESEG